MENTRNFIKSHSEKVNDFDRKTYSTLIEQEQFNFSNQTINQIKQKRIGFISRFDFFLNAEQLWF